MLIKVISTRTVYGDKAELQRLVLSDEKGSHFIYRVFGEIQGYMQGQGRHKRIDKETGEVHDTVWTKFSGDFMAISAAQEEFESATCFLPEYVAGPLMQALKDDRESTIEMGFDIYVKYAKDSATSYEFIAQPMRREGEISKARAMATHMAPLPNLAAKALEDHSKKGKVQKP